MVAAKDDKAGSLQKIIFRQLDNLDKLHFPVHFFSHSARKWNHALWQSLKKCRDKMSQAKTSSAMFGAIITLEQELITIINQVLASLENDKPLQLKEGKIKTISALEKVLIETNLHLAQVIYTIVTDAMADEPESAIWLHIYQIMQHISTDSSEWNTMNLSPKALANVTHTMELSKKMVLTTLLKWMNHEPGIRLIQQLSNLLSSDMPLKIGIEFTKEHRGIEVGPLNIQAYAKLVKHAPQLTIEEYKHRTLSPNAGCGSVLMIPVLFDGEDCDPERTMGQDEVALVSMRASMRGMIYFERTRIYYMPFQLVLIHELIHVLHNAQGLNARNLPLIEQDRHLWSNYEEYLTIVGNPINESQFTAVYGAKQRNNHHALDAQILFEANMQNSLRALLSEEISNSGLCMEDQHAQSHENRLFEAISAESKLDDEQQMTSPKLITNT